MPAYRRRTARALIAILLIATLGSCRTVPRADYDEMEAELVAVRARLEQAEQQVAERDETIRRLESDVESLRVGLARERADASSVEDDLDLALRQLGTLREDRLDLREELDALEREIRRLRAATALADQPTGTARAAAPASERADDPARGFVRVRSVGFQNDPRAAQRLSAAAPGIGVDTSTGTAVIFDSRLDYEQTLAYLTIVGPDGRRPRMQLTTQYTTDTAPIGLRTAFITIEGGDPIDPIDPIILVGEPVRETDGEILQESLAIDTDRSIVDRLSKMVSSDRFLVTFVGASDQVVHRPSVTERAAMSNILFAYMDLGGLR